MGGEGGEGEGLVHSPPLPCLAWRLWGWVGMGGWVGGWPRQGRDDQGGMGVPVWWLVDEEKTGGPLWVGGAIEESKWAVRWRKAWTRRTKNPTHAPPNKCARGNKRRQKEEGGVGLVCGVVGGGVLVFRGCVGWMGELPGTLRLGRGAATGDLTSQPPPTQLDPLLAFLLCPLYPTPLSPPPLPGISPRVSSSSPLPTDPADEAFRLRSSSSSSSSSASSIQSTSKQCA